MKCSRYPAFIVLPVLAILITPFIAEAKQGREDVPTLGGVQGVYGQPTPVGEAVMAWPVTIAPTWFDPSTAPPQITPFGMLYALHDALVRPLPGQKMGNSLAESWTESPDGLMYEFKLRRGLKFHNGDPGAAEDVKVSFERY